MGIVWHVQEAECPLIFIFFDGFKMPLVESDTHLFLGNKSGKSVGTFCNKCCCICFGFWFVLFTYFELVYIYKFPSRKCSRNKLPENCKWYIRRPRRKNDLLQVMLKMLISKSHVLDTELLSLVIAWWHQTEPPHGSEHILQYVTWQCSI